MGRSIEQLNIKEKETLVQEVLDKKNGVHDKDWCDMVADWDLEISPDTLRKAGVGIKLASDSGMMFPKGGEQTRDAMDGYMERQKLYDLHRDIRKDLREQSRSELIRETIRKAIAAMPPIELPDAGIEENDKTPDRDLIIGIGDFHYGADFTVDGLRGEELNKYNSDVFKYRMSELVRRIDEIAREQHPQQITVMVAGDMLDGLLRNSQISRLEFGVVESAMHLSEILSKWLSELYLRTGLPVRFYAVRGNHGEIRPLGSKAGQFPEENMERIVMHYLHERFRGSGRTIMIGDSDAPMMRIVDVCGYQIMLIHGHGADIQEIARSHQILYHENIDLFICGHLHKSQTFMAGVADGSNILIERVPSICGMDPYAQSKGLGSPAGATVIVMEKGIGRRCVYPVVLK